MVWTDDINNNNYKTAYCQFTQAEDFKYCYENYVVLSKNLDRRFYTFVDRPECVGVRQCRPLTQHYGLFKSLYTCLLYTSKLKGNLTTLNKVFAFGNIKILVGESPKMGETFDKIATIHVEY